MDRLHVATLNIRNLADRWPERLPLLLADMAALQPDVLGAPGGRLPDAAGPPDRGGRGGPLRRVRGWAGRPEYGNSLLVREPLVADDGGPAGPRPRPVGASGARRLGRAAPSSMVVDPPPPRGRRRRRARRAGRGCSSTGWRCAPAADAQVVMGDFNADPAEPAAERMRAAGFRSALRRGERRRAGGHLAVGHPGAGRWTRTAIPPASTTSGSVAPSGSRRRGSCSTGRDPDDPTLYPSDHLGLSPPSSRSGRRTPGDR